MRRKTSTFNRSTVLNTSILFLLASSFFTESSILVHAAPTSISNTAAADAVKNVTSESIIRSIGFRNCSPYSSSSSASLESSTSASSDNTIKLSNLALLYDGDSNTISLRAEGITDHELDATSAHILLTAYDRVFYDQTIDLAKVTPFIPHFQGHFAFQETFPAPILLPEQLPKQLFSLPAVEALASIQLYNARGDPVLCTSVPLTNTVSADSTLISIASVSLTAAAIALTAISSILASFTSAAVLTSMPLAAVSGGTGGANPVSSGLSPSLWDVVSFCQFISMSGSLNLEYPELLQQWTQNFAWSMGLVENEGWNRAIDGLRLRTSKDTDADQGQQQWPVSKSVLDGRIIYSGNMGSSASGNATNTTGTVSDNGKVTALSIQSIVDGVFKSHIGQPTMERNQTPALANVPRSMTSSLAFRSEALQLSKRQTVSTVSPSPKAAQPGGDLLPSLADSSFMNRVGDISTFKSIDTQPFSAVAPQLIPPVSWPQGDYHPSTSPLMQPGLGSFGQRLHIPARNMFMTSLFLFLILLLATSIFALILRIVLEGYAYFRPGKFKKLRQRFSSYYLGNMLRVILLAYFAVATTAFFQLTLQDTWAITLLAVMTLLLFLALITYITLRLRRAGGKSLFVDQRLKSKYGVLYDQYVLSTYWFFVPVLIYQILKAAVVGLGHGSNNNLYEYSLGRHGSASSWVQTSLLLLVEIGFATLLIWKRPFADSTPNRLNSALSCVRVLNVVMLAVLIEGATISTVSRTVVGVIITGTQAVMMIVLAFLVLYQLGQVLWRLWVAVIARKEDKKIGGKNSLDGEEVMVVSVQYNDKYDKDRGDDDEPQGRKASEHSRSNMGSITSLVGMIGIGSNPMIRCTPASDDEDDGFGMDDDSIDKDIIPGRYYNQGIAALADLNSIAQEVKSRTLHVSESRRGSIRDLTQSIESLSSPIHDNHDLADLPDSIHPHVLKDQQVQQKALDQIDEGVEEMDNILEMKSSQSALVVPFTDSNGHWVQSAYMTRRRSESSAQQREQYGTRDQGGYAATGNISTTHRQREGADDSHDQEMKLHQQRRRRPVSLGVSRQSPEAMAFDVEEVGFRQRDRHIGRASRQFTLPSFRGTYIPESLLAGPPPPPLSIEPRRASVSRATLATPPSMSPILTRTQQDEPEVMSPLGSESPNVPALVAATIQTTPVAGATSMTASITTFEEYRFPDERSPSFSNVGQDVNQHSAVSTQRAIHPLSPLHPDYRHPDDMYNASIPSPNEDGPAFASMEGFSRGNANVPNRIQDGSGTRRESRPAIFDVEPRSVAATATSFGKNTTGSMKRSMPELRIVTAIKSIVPPPQIPIPTLPMTPFSSSMAAASSLTDIWPEASTELSKSKTDSDYDQHQEQLTPLSSNNMYPSVQSDHHVLHQEPNTKASTSAIIASPTLRFGQRERNSSNIVDCSLSASGVLGGFSPSRQRALSTTPLAPPSRPLTVSSSRRDARAAR